MQADVNLIRCPDELIGQAGLGYSFDPLKDDVTPDVYAEAIKQYVSVSDPHLCR